MQNWPADHIAQPEFLSELANINFQSGIVPIQGCCSLATYDLSTMDNPKASENGWKEYLTMQQKQTPTLSWPASLLCLILIALSALTSCGTGTSAATPTPASPTPPTSAPTVSVGATSTSVPAGTPSTLNVTVTNATQVVITDNVGGTPITLNASGGAQKVTPSVTTIYTVTATGQGGTATAQITINVTSAPQTVPAPTVTIAASTASIVLGGATTFNVTATDATQVVLSDNIDKSTFTLPSVGGSQTVKPNATGTYIYTVTANGQGGTATAQITVNVTSPPQSVPAPTVAIAASPVSIVLGTATTFQVTATGATQVLLSDNVDGSTFALSGAGGSQSVKPAASGTYIYTATATGQGGTATAQITINVTPPPPVPSVTIAATPLSIVLGTATTFQVIATGATQLVLSDNVDSSTFNLPGTGGTQSVKPAVTGVYIFTAVATGQGGTSSAQITINVTSPPALPTVTIAASPASIALGVATTFQVTATGAAQVVLSDNIDSNTFTLPPAGGSQSVQPAAAGTYIYTATATGAGGTASAQVTLVVSAPAADITSVSHIIVMMQENRSFDHYFGHLNDYREAHGLPADVDDLRNAGNVSIPSWDGSGNISLFHIKTPCIGDLSPSWQEAHNMVNLTSPDQGKWGTPPPMNGFAAMAGGYAEHNPVSGGTDVAGRRAMGYYTDNELPFYYWAATTFATSDRWFSPALTRTQPNRMYALAATSNGYAFPGDNDPLHPPLNMGTDMSIFQLLQENNITWRVYVTDNYIPGDLKSMDTYENYFPWAFGFTDHFANANTFATDAANGTLPQVAWIESGYTETASDEHPQNNILKGAAYTESMVRALMQSPSWANAVFFIDYDEGGGFYDHVPPVAMPSPDGKPPYLAASDPTGDFTTTGFRIPLMVISPFTKPGYVSHTNADNTAVLKFIETRFGLPALTKRDAAQMDMTEFFDWTAPNLSSINTPDIEPSMVCSWTNLQ